MPKTKAKPVHQLIAEEKLRIHELEEKLNTQVYFETMPEYGPVYQYCYQTSNQKIAYSQQSVDSWIRAVIKHMATRITGHGGATTKAVLISIPDNLTEESYEHWLSLQVKKIDKKARPKAITVGNLQGDAK